MEEIKFTYMMEPRDGGFFQIFNGDQSYLEEEGDIILFFYNEKDLLEALKTHKKVSVFTVDDDDETMTEGERLSKMLNLPFQHP